MLMMIADVPGWKPTLLYIGRRADQLKGTLTWHPRRSVMGHADRGVVPDLSVSGDNFDLWRK